MTSSLPRVAVVFGTRPELIKVAPILQELKRRGIPHASIHSGQHTDLVEPLLKFFQIEPTVRLDVMEPGQGLNRLGAKVLSAMDTTLAELRPETVVVQGDTTTAVMAALAAFQRRITVAHVEAGLRSGHPTNPFPEEMNRRMITPMASWHFAATEGNRRTLLGEGIAGDQIIVTGNPVVDALYHTAGSATPGPIVREIEHRLAGRKPIIVTTHRRENFGSTMRHHLQALRRVAEARPDIGIVFPVHPNPEVRAVAAEELSGCDGIMLVDPLGYQDFVLLLTTAHLIVSDSGGIQEEATALGKPMLILRSTTERPEAVASGVARLVGDDPALESLLLEALDDQAWFARAGHARTTFGDGKASARIVDALVGAATPTVKPLTAPLITTAAA
jgi:UDP-N-acetylglucosamine 2-epimerase (non-hydrolysing)